MSRLLEVWRCRGEGSDDEGHTGRASRWRREEAAELLTLLISCDLFHNLQQRRRFIELKGRMSGVTMGNLADEETTRLDFFHLKAKTTALIIDVSLTLTI